MKTTRFDASRANPTSCVMTTMVMPSLASWRMTSSTSRIISASSALVGSSKSMIFGSIASARAIATRCCWPPERRAGCTSAFSGMPTFARRRSARSRDSRRERPRARIGASMMFSAAVRCGKRLNDWNTIPTSRRRRFTSTFFSWTRRPSTTSEPLSIGSSRLIVRIIVLLPDPEGPMTTTTSRSLSERSIPRRTCSCPKCLCTSRNSIKGAKGTERARARVAEPG